MEEKRTAINRLDDIILRLNDSMSKKWEGAISEREDLASLLYSTSLAGFISEFIVEKNVSALFSAYLAYRTGEKLFVEDSRPKFADKDNKSMYPLGYIAGIAGIVLGAVGLDASLSNPEMYNEQALGYYGLIQFSFSFLCAVSADYVSRTRS